MVCRVGNEPFVADGLIPAEVLRLKALQHFGGTEWMAEVFKV